MIVTAKFNDDSAYTSHDLKDSLSHLFGENAEISVEPTDKSPEGIIAFGLNEMLAHQILDIYYNSGKYTIEEKYSELTKQTLDTLEMLIDQTIRDTITKLEE